MFLDIRDWGPFVRSALLIFSGLLFCIFADPASAEKRVALVIGMSKYQQVPRLANPARDADAMAALFRKAGFDLVESERDLGISDLRRVIREFSEISRTPISRWSTMRGHGIEVDGTNYLVPADARLLSDFDRRGRDRIARSRPQGARSRQAAQAGHPRCLPRQSVRQVDEAKRRQPLDRTRARQDRTGDVGHLDRFRRQGRRGGERWRRPEQSVRGGAGQVHRRTRAGFAAGVRPGSR